MTTETTEPDKLIEEVEELLAKFIVCADHVAESRLFPQCPELLRRLVERDKRNRDALKMMVELWDANHPDDPCACSDADYSVGQHAVMCETCVARACMEGRDPNADA